jgi:hypothetical protein
MIKILYNPSSTETVQLKDVGLKIKPQESHSVPSTMIDYYLSSNEVLDAIRDGDVQVTDGTTTFTDAKEGEVYFRTKFGDTAFTLDSGDNVEQYDNVLVEDTPSGVKATSIFMNMLTVMRELYNAADNPVFSSGFTPILGSGGWAEAHADSIDNLNNIHAKHGWHMADILSRTYERPDDLLIYYGWMNSFNSAQNGWDNEKVAQDMAKYDLIVLGAGIENPSHGDYSNTSVIIPRIKALNPSAKIFGYVTVNQSLSNFEGKVDDWDDLEVHGIFMDEAGYDYGKTRSEFNDRVDYVHNQTYANICFANAWNMDHIIGTTNDPSYPNSTYNSGTVESNLTYNDWYLLESFAVNTAAYSGNNGYASKSDWSARGSKAITHRYTYGINLASVGIIADGDSADEDLFDFSFISACMWGFEANGSSDTYYGASSAKSEFLPRPDVEGLQYIWSLSPSVQADVNDSDVYHRYVKRGKLSVDFSSGAQVSSITKY